MDRNDGRVRWRFHAEAPVVSGVTPTAGGLIFAGGVITYQVGGRQYVAATSGNVSRFIWGETGLPYVGRGNRSVGDKPGVGGKAAGAYGNAALISFRADRA